MHEGNNIPVDKISAVDIISKLEMKLSFRENLLVEVLEEQASESKEEKNQLQQEPYQQQFKQTSGPLYIGKGLIDLQVNGINGIDFNNGDLTEQEVIDATNYLLSQGVTTYYPTIITNSKDNICRILRTISQACAANELVNSCISGIHLEGPFLSPVPGARGAHHEAYLRTPDWELFEEFQAAADGNIKLITIAPELAGALPFIEKCRQQRIMVSIGHSMANAEQITAAVRAGASMATHLGNAVPLLLPRHPNILWELLAQDHLFACIIADGIHVPDAFIKVVMKTKTASTIIVSDATCFAGMPPGEYKNHIGGSVILDAQKRVSMKSEPGLLAGAAKTLTENIDTLIQRQLTSPAEAWKMATSNVRDLFIKNGIIFESNNDYVLFYLQNDKVTVQTVVKNGLIVWPFNHLIDYHE